MSTLQWLQLVMGAAFVLAGLIAWRARPGNRTGPLMLTFGVATMAGRALVQTQWAPATTVGILVMDGATAVFVYLLLAFPTGRLRSRRDWLILGPVLFVFVPLELLWLSFLDVPDGLNLIGFWPDAG